MITQEQARQLPGHDLLDRDGARIGQISQVFVDDTTAEPNWVTVKTGWFGLSESFVPLVGVQSIGRELRAAYDSATVKDAPRFRKDEPLSRQDEDQLYAHYGLSETTTTDRAADRAPDGRYYGADGPAGTDPAVTGPVPVQAPGAGQPPTSGPDRSGPGRLRPFDGSSDRAGGRPGIAIAQALVCPRCGSYVAADLIDRHEDFHMAIGHPAGNFARHDVSAAGQT